MLILDSMVCMYVLVINKKDSNSVFFSKDLHKKECVVLVMVTGHNNLNKVLEEGICQVLGHMWLETQRYAPIDVAAASSSSSSSNAAKKGVWSELEKKLVDFYKYEIETDESAVYGEGFRKVNYMVTNSSLQETLKEILPRRG